MNALVVFLAMACGVMLLHGIAVTLFALNPRRTMLARLQNYMPEPRR